MIVPVLLLGAIVQQAPAADSLRDLARRLPDASLAVEARARPSAVRAAVQEAMELAVRTAADGDSELALARRIAAAYAVAWSDSFFVRELRRFATWPRVRRVAKVEAERLRQSGVTAFEQEGPAAALPLWRRALARARAAADTAGIAALHGNIGAAHLEEGRLDSAESHLARARRLASLVGDYRVEANAVGMLAGLSEERGELEAARQRYAQALALRERTGDSRGVAADYNNLGNLAQALGDLAEARRQYEAALALNRRDGREGLAARNQLNLAGVAAADGEYAEAETLYRNALAALRQYALWPDVAAALLGLGQLQTRRAEYPEAIATLREASAVYGRTGPATQALTVRRALAAVLAAAGRMQDAIDELRLVRRDALSINQRAGPDPGGDRARAGRPRRAAQCAGGSRGALRTSRAAVSARRRSERRGRSPAGTRPAVLGARRSGPRADGAGGGAAHAAREREPARRGVDPPGPGAGRARTR